MESPLVPGNAFILSFNAVPVPDRPSEIALLPGGEDELMLVACAHYAQAVVLKDTYSLTVAIDRFEGLTGPKALHCYIFVGSGLNKKWTKYGPFTEPGSYSFAVSRVDLIKGQLHYMVYVGPGVAFDQATIAAKVVSSSVE